MLWQITDRIWTLDSFFLAPCSSSFLNVDGRIMSLVLKREFRETVFLREQIRAPTRFFIWHLVLTKILQITGKADDDPRVVVFFYHSFDQVRVGVPTARADLLYKSHILHACRIKLNDEVEDFYNSHCGWTSTGVLPCLNTHTYILQTKRECFCIFFFNIVRGKAPRGRWFKEQSEQRRTQRCRMSKNTKGENSFLYV